MKKAVPVWENDANMVPKPNLDKCSGIVPRKLKQSLWESLCALKVGRWPSPVRWKKQADLGAGVTGGNYLKKLITGKWTQGWLLLEELCQSHAEALTVRNRGLLVMDTVLVLFYQSLTVLWCARELLFREWNTAPRTLYLQIKFPQLVEEIQ